MKKSLISIIIVIVMTSTIGSVSATIHVNHKKELPVLRIGEQPSDVAQKELTLSSPSTLKREKIDLNFSKKKNGDQNQNKRIEKIGLIASLVSALNYLVLLASGWVSLFFAAAIVLGIISLFKFRKHPEVFKGRGFALAGLFSGLLFAVLLGLILLF